MSDRRESRGQADSARRPRSEAYLAVSAQVARRVARGEVDQAVAVLRRELARIAPIGDEEGRRFLYGILAVSHGRAGDPEGVLAVLREMEEALEERPETWLGLAEGYLLLLGEAGPARAWSRRARESLAGAATPERCESLARARSLEGRAALLAGERDEALRIFQASELPDPVLAGELLGAGVPAGELRETLRSSLAAHRAHEERGGAGTARSQEVRRLLERLEPSEGGTR
jgi:pentatricopeptide repeat protein